MHASRSDLAILLGVPTDQRPRWVSLKSSAPCDAQLRVRAALNRFVVRRVHERCGFARASCYLAWERYFSHQPGDYS